MPGFIQPAFLTLHQNKKKEEEEEGEKPYECKTYGKTFNQNLEIIQPQGIVLVKNPTNVSVGKPFIGAGLLLHQQAHIG